MVRELNVEKMVDQQSTIFRERNQSQFSRLLDLSPVFSTYYHLDGITSTAAIGSRDIMTYVGPESPVRFNKIHSMPLYGIEVIGGELNFDEALGTQTDVEGMALVLNGVIDPLPGDHFTLDSFNPNVIFVVTAINTRAIRGEDHKIITYNVTNSDRLRQINKQVEDEYDTIFRNIGTRDAVVLRRSDYYDLQQITETYKSIRDYYLDEFYDESLGYIRTPEDMNERANLGHATCKYMIRFMFDNQVIVFDQILKSIFAFETPLPFESKHNKIYSRNFPLTHFVKNRLVRDADYWVCFQTMPVSLFKSIDDINLIQSISFPQITDNTYPFETYRELLFDKQFTNAVIDKRYENLSAIPKLVAKIYNNEVINITEFNETVDDYDTSDLFRMYFVPYILWGLMIKVKSIQNKSLDKPENRLIR